MALDDFGFIMPTEVVGAQVFVGDPVAQRNEDGGEHRGGRGEDGLFGPTLGFDAQELRLQNRYSWCER